MRLLWLIRKTLKKVRKYLGFFNMAAEAHLSGGGKLNVVYLDPKVND
jgi:hypothetical protein